MLLLNQTMPEIQKRPTDTIENHAKRAPNMLTNKIGHSLTNHDMGPNNAPTVPPIDHRKNGEHRAGHFAPKCN